ncbi:MAG: HAD-IA family hydrolase [Actinomycetota bacterium]
MESPRSIRRALLFDFDGLIVDTETMWAEIVIDALREDGVTIRMDDVRHLVGVAGHEFDEAWMRFSDAHLSEQLDRKTLMARVWPRCAETFPTLEVLPGVVELMAGARDRGWRTGLGTGSQMQTVGPRLDHHGLRENFDAIVTIDDVERGKPSPDIYLTLADRLEVAPESCIVLEDSVHGCEAALAAGMRVIACPCGVTRGSAFPADATVVASLLEIDLGSVTPASAPLRRST